MEKFKLLIPNVHQNPLYVKLNNFVEIDDDEFRIFFDKVKNFKLKKENDVFQGKVSEKNEILPNDSNHWRYQIEFNEIKKNDRIPWIEKVIDELTKLVTTCFSNIVKSSTAVSILYAKENCTKQCLHTDYKLHKTCKMENFSYFALIALMDNTSIIIGNDEIVQINKGSVFFARGDLVHAGNAYQESNIRIHLYFDNVNILPKPTFNNRESYPVEKLSVKEQKECGTASKKLTIVMLHEFNKQKNIKKLKRKEDGRESRKKRK
jgi:hypothetical protein